MNDAESMIRQGMAKIKISNACDMAKHIGITRQSFCKKLNKPSTFTLSKVLRMAKEFKWTDSEVGEFVRSIGL